MYLDRIEQLSHELVHCKSKALLLNAYPGFGKSRLAAHIARRVLDEFPESKVVILTRSHLEIEQLYKFLLDAGVGELRIGMLLGRRECCPLRASTSTECMLARSRGECKAMSKGSNVNVRLSEVSRLYAELRVCPYEYLTSRSKQMHVVVAPHSYLSSMELYKVLCETLKGFDKVFTVIDEAHNVLLGVEHSVEMSIDDVERWARMGNRLALEIVRRIRASEEGGVIVRDVGVEDLLPHSEPLGSTVELMMSSVVVDLRAIMYEPGAVSKIVLRTLTLSTLRDLMSRSYKCFLLTASISRKFLDLVAHIAQVQYVEESRTPHYLRNLRIVFVNGVEITRDVRYTRHMLDKLFRLVREFISRAPEAGGLAVLTSSKEFLRIMVSTYRHEIELLPSRVFIADDPEKVRMELDEFKRTARRERAVLMSYALSPAMEGVNFLDRELIGVIVLGFPYPQFNAWNQLKSAMYKKMGLDPFKSTYLFHAVSTTVQIVGRLMRDLDRYGKVVVLVDSRFYRFRRYYPSWFKVHEVVEIDSALNDVERLWSK